MHLKDFFSSSDLQQMDIFTFSALFFQSEGKMFGPEARSKGIVPKGVERQERARQEILCILVCVCAFCHDQRRR